MSRYVNADAVWQSLPNDLPFKASVKRVLMQAPPADVVEVVRCKDCKYYDRGICYYPAIRYVAHDADHYCSYGERRDNDGEIH
jgi:hypothetical protein